MARGAFLLPGAWIGVLLSLSTFVSAQSSSGARKDLFLRRCSGCHAVDEDKEGPRLRGVYGRQSGSLPSFKYSQGLKDASVTWDSDSLDRWLMDPEKLAPDTDMAFRMPKAGERSQIIAYLKEISGK